jgi:hypothetical protein
MGFVGHIVHFDTSESRIIDALFFMLRWDWYGLYKNKVGTRYAGTRYPEPVFLHLVGFAGHVVHSDASGS